MVFWLFTAKALWANCFRPVRAIDPWTHLDTTMNDIPESHCAGSASELETKHFLASRTHQEWQDVWELFYQNPWFRKKLDLSARYVVRRSGLGNHCVDDIKQEALVEFAKSVRRNPSLGFDPARGDYRAFLTTIIRRCCQKGLRQFRMLRAQPLDDNFLHPFYDDNPSLENSMDFRHLARQIPEPYRGIIRQLCSGLTVEQIARKHNRSKRTIYRWIDKAIALLQSKYFDSFEM